MLPELLRILEHPPRSLLVTLETYLAALVFRVPKALLLSAIPALTMTIRASGNHELIFNLLHKFYLYLKRFHAFLEGSPPATAARYRW